MRRRATRAAFATAIESLESRLLLARMIGIDVSEYQGNVNWSTVKNVGGRTFTILRASHGLAKDASVDQKMNLVNGAPSVGMYTGFYHYATYNTGTSALQEANFYFDIIKPYLKANSKVL